jgi:hypothetical protein
MQFDSSKIAFLALLDWILALHIVPRIRYLGFTTRGKKGPLTTTGDLSACKSKRTLIQLLTVNRFRLASDCTNAVRSIQGGSLGSYGNAIKEIRDTMKLFGQVEEVHEVRTANGDADRLAKSSIYSQLGRHVWFFLSVGRRSVLLILSNT